MVELLRHLRRRVHTLSSPLVREAVNDGLLSRLANASTVLRDDVNTGASHESPTASHVGFESLVFPTNRLVSADVTVDSKNLGAAVSSALLHHSLNTECLVVAIRPQPLGTELQVIHLAQVHRELVVVIQDILQMLVPRDHDTLQTISTRSASRSQARQLHHTLGQ